MAGMELPKPPMWYWMVDEGTPPPAVPASRNLRSFGSADFDERVWEEDEDEPIADRIAALKAMNRGAVAAFAEALQNAGEAPAALEPVEAKLIALHEAIGKLRIYEARESLLKVMDFEIKERVEALRRFRLRMASTLGRVDEMLRDDDYFEFEKRDLRRYDDEITLQEALDDPARWRRILERAGVGRPPPPREEADPPPAFVDAATTAAAPAASEESS